MSVEIRPIAEILVPMDFSDCAKRALEFAKRVAVGSQARLHLLYVDDDPMLVESATDESFRREHAKLMSARFDGLLSEEEAKRFRVVMTTRCGTAYHEIETYVLENSIDLIVIGNVGRSAVADVLLGSVSAHVIRHASCPVLSVKHE
jgi:nucleotide-binding universal stress UspA family protein